jgi:hypothetical protein
MSHTNDALRVTMFYMKPKVIGRRSLVMAAGLAVSATAVGMRIYAVREVVAELLILFILFAAIAIASAVLLAIDEIAIRAFTWVRIHILSVHLHFRHAAAAGNAMAPSHKTWHFS